MTRTKPEKRPTRHTGSKTVADGEDDDEDEPPGRTHFGDAGEIVCEVPFEVHGEVERAR
jgi:hypothetical protein